MQAGDVGFQRARALAAHSCDYFAPAPANHLAGSSPSIRANCGRPAAPESFRRRQSPLTRQNAALQYHLIPARRFRQYNRTVNGMFQLPDVARPAIVEQNGGARRGLSTTGQPQPQSALLAK